MSGYPHAQFITSAHEPVQFVPDEGTELAFAGRSNSGKSSAINAIVGRRQLARTSRTPGRTQLVNFFALDGSRRLVDLPGFGFARVTRSLQDHWRKLLEAYFAGRSSLRGLVLVCDSRRGLTDLDWQLLDWVGARGQPVHVLLTKIDKLGRAEAAERVARVRGELPADVSLQPFSAVTGEGVEVARERMESLLGPAEPATVRRKKDGPGRGVQGERPGPQ